MSRKRAKCRTRGGKLHSTEAKKRGGRARKTRADLEQQLKACRRQIAQARERIAEATLQQTATSEMLRLISNSPIQSVLDAVAEHAARLCDASNARIWRLEDSLLRLVASYGESAATMDGREGLPVDRDTVTGRAACDRRTFHVHDIAAEDSEYPLGSRLVKGQGWHTTLATPLLREDTPIGTILVRRTQVRPFDDKQIALLETFANQAAIAIENVRLFEAEKQRSLALARSEMRLAEAQRLSQTGSFNWKPSTNERIWSDEIYRIFDLDPASGPDLEKAFERVHADQRDHIRRLVELQAHGEVSVDEIIRLSFPDGSIKIVHHKSHSSRDDDGEVEVIGALSDITKVKAAEEVLREREAKIRRLVDANIIGIFIWDFDGRILEANEAFLHIVGYVHEDLVAGRIRWTDLTPPEWRDRDMRLVQEHELTGRLQPFEKEYFRQDGSRVPVLVGVATFEEGGKQGVAFVLDLTERKRAEERLRVQHTVAQILAEAATIEDATPRILRAMGECLGWDVGVLWRVDLEVEALRSVVLWHKSSIEVPEFERISRESTFIRGLGMPGRVWSSREPEYIHDVVPDDNFPRAAIAEQEGLHAALGFPILLGEEVLGVIEFFSREIKQPDQELLYVLATIGSQIGQFIERKRAEEALRGSEYKLRQIIDTVPSLLWSVAPDGEPTHVSQSVLDYSGMRMEDFKSLGWEAFLHPDDFPETVKAFTHAIQTGTSYEAVHRLRRAADGEYRWHYAHGEPLRDREGRIVQWYGLSVDIDETKKAQDRLRRSEAYLAEAQRLSHTGTAVYNETEIPYWTEEASRLFGFDPLQGIPSREAVWQRIHPDDVNRVNENIAHGLREKRSFANEFKIILPDGTIKHIKATNNPVFSASGELLEIVATGVDVTAQKRAEQALRESEARFRDYAETASDWFWEIGPDYKFTLLTENAFGSNAASRIGTACWDHAFDLETEPEKWRLVQEALDSRKQFRDFVYRSARGDGAPMYVRASGKPVFDTNGEFRGYRGTGTDVTALIHVQEALRASERSSRSIIDGIAGLVAVMAPNGELETVNRQVFDYFGRSLEWLKNWGTNDAVHSEDLRNITEIFERAIASGIPFNYEQRLRRFDGEYRWFDNRGVPIRDDSGRIERWYVLLTDIEDRARALAQLEQMQSDIAHMNRVSMMGELAASLSHEITQPIASARNNARAAQNFLDMQPPDLGEVREALSCVVGDADRAGDIVDRIREHIKKTPPRKGHFDVNEAINEVLLLARSAITENEVSVRTRFVEGPLSAHGDRVQLQQVVLNLILNAVEAMASVEVRTRLLLISTEQNREDEVLVAIRDSGPGIEPDHLERVFEAFYTTKSNGVGMGLSICRSIISAQGGRLWAETKKPRGAVFLFTLPSTGESS